MNIICSVCPFDFEIISKTLMLVNGIEICYLLAAWHAKWHYSTAENCLWKESIWYSTRRFIVVSSDFSLIFYSRQMMLDFIITRSEVVSDSIWISFWGDVEFNHPILQSIVPDDCCIWCFLLNFAFQICWQRSWRGARTLLNPSCHCSRERKQPSTSPCSARRTCLLRTCGQKIQVITDVPIILSCPHLEPSLNSFRLLIGRFWPVAIWDIGCW